MPQTPQIKSVSRLVEAVKRRFRPDDRLWFRGESDVSWVLKPTLCRAPCNLTYEHTLIKRFRQKAYPFLTEIPRTEWEWLFLMQHHKVPTRLLDWSESPLVGLYFAVSNPAHDHVNGRVWCFLPAAYNRRVHHINNPIASDIPSFDIDHNALDPFLPSKIGTPNNSQEPPIAAIASQQFDLKPMAFVFENVKALLRESFATYFSYIELQLRHPTVLRKPDEAWQYHRSRLEKHHTGGRYDDLHYRVVSELLNAADYGVPQKRERVFIVGIRADLGVEWSFPTPSHSHDALLWDQWISGEYWERHSIRKRTALLGNRVKAPRIDVLRRLGEQPRSKPWRTVRDALQGLPDPVTRRHNSFHNHVHNPGARSYPGHTGSDYDEASKVLKAGDHGVPGGENTLALPKGGVRYFTVRECARIQTFPDEMIFPTSWTESMRQIGNAVPVSLAELIGKHLKKALFKKAKGTNLNG